MIMKLGKLFAKVVPGLALKLADEVITEVTVSNPDDTIFDDIEKKIKSRKKKE